MGCAASTDASANQLTHAVGSTTAKKYSADGAAKTNNGVTADQQQVRPSVATPITAAEIVSGGLLLLSLACEASPLPGGAVVAAVLKSIYTIFNSAVAKQIWMAEFMVRRTHSNGQTRDEAR